MVEQSQLVCPQCGQIDAVTKATVLYTSGMASSSGSVHTAYGSGTTSAFSQTALSLRLEPPKKPIKPSAGYWIGSVMFLVPGVLMVGSYLYYVSSLMKGVLVRIPDTANLLTGLTFTLIGGFLLVSSIVMLKKFPERNRQWLQKMQLYDELYYCGRCDGVFSVNERRFTRVEMMQQYLKNK